ncbi:ribonuclease J [Candidatus Parcubacteria bacterium]|nr:ribonuclease J [Candidatus Parcubacteria bacterium]
MRNDFSFLAASAPAQPSRRGGRGRRGGRTFSPPSREGRPLPAAPMKPVTDHVRIIPLGGLGEVGRNMMALEYAGDIVIIDAGVGFPDEDMPGIDFIIPNVKYLEERKRHIRGVLNTHGHYDHIGALPYVIEKLGNPAIWTAPLTRAMLIKRHEEFPRLAKLQIHQVQAGNKVVLGNFQVEFFHVNHSIPDDLGLAITTPIGLMIHTSDFKFDFTPLHEDPVDIETLTAFGRRGVLLLMSDSTGAEIEGHSLSETTVQQNLEVVFQKTEGRIIIATFSSMLNRIQQLVTLSEKYNRKVIVEGYSMKANVEIAKQLGYLKAQKGTLVTARETKHLPANRLTILCTGAQGEDNAVLMRLVNREHRDLSIEKGDTVIFSASVIPGNERSVQALKDNLYRQGARVYQSPDLGLHTSGHARRDDQREIINLLKPKFFLPIHGMYSMMFSHAELAEETGIQRRDIVIAENGEVVALYRDKLVKLKETVPANYVMVDGLGVGDVGNVVLRDRQVMAQDGMVVTIAIVDSQTGKVRGEPDVISRGFIYMKDSKEFMGLIRRKVKEIVSRSTSHEKPINWPFVKDNIRDKLGQFLFTKTQRRPMVLPVIIEV